MFWLVVGLIFLIGGLTGRVGVRFIDIPYAPVVIGAVMVVIGIVQIVQGLTRGSGTENTEDEA